jgi:antitoxin (DNA-binding transcriptional repressor) of toxin-antitoxin stability system
MQVGAFKEVCYLARLPNLVDLCFSDPHWGECPLAGLCNYQTYVLFNLQQLTSLDTLVLSDETKQLAEATYMKKKMYYNMRIKTLRRNTSNAIRKANQGRTARVGTAVAVLNLLRRQLKGIAGELAEAEHYEHYIPKPGVLEGLREKASAIRAVMAQREAEVRAAATAFEECKQRVHELCNDYVRRMMVELETGGNIRMEDGKPSDLWYSSCVDLVNSRFFASDFAAIGIKGLKARLSSLLYACSAGRCEKRKRLQ